MSVARRPVGRPSRTSLPEILDAAIALGIDHFTLQAVAARVGVAEATVYNYVDGRDDLYYRACDRVFATMSLDIDPDADDGTWSAYMDVISERAVDLAAAHPGLADYLFYGPFGPETHRIFSTLVAEVQHRRAGPDGGELDGNTGYLLASRAFISSLSLAEFPEYRRAGTWLRRSLMLGMEQQVAAGNLPELPGDWTDVLDTDHRR